MLPESTGKGKLELTDPCLTECEPIISQMLPQEPETFLLLHGVAALEELDRGAVGQA